MRLKRITEQKVKSSILRSKARWVEYGEPKHQIFSKLRKKWTMSHNLENGSSVNSDNFDATDLRF